MKDQQYRYAVLVLAAGQSRRYGSVKQIAEIEGVPMIRHVVQRLVAPKLYHVVVVSGARTELMRPLIADLEAEIVENPGWETGMASSIQAGASYVSDTYPSLEGLVVVLGDQWKIRREHLETLLKTAMLHKKNIVATDYDGNPGVPVYFPREKWAILSSLSGDEGARHLLRGRTDVMLLNLPEAKTDLDYPDDVEIAR
jgi:molybdenum cofactor cytidylyltransferase